MKTRLITRYKLISMTQVQLRRSLIAVKFVPVPVASVRTAEDSMLMSTQHDGACRYLKWRIDTSTLQQAMAGCCFAATDDKRCYSCCTGCWQRRFSRRRVQVQIQKAEISSTRQDFLLQRDAMVGEQTQAGTRAGNHQRHTHRRETSAPDATCRPQTFTAPTLANHLRTQGPIEARFSAWDIPKTAGPQLDCSLTQGGRNRGDNTPVLIRVSVE